MLSNAEDARIFSKRTDGTTKTIINSTACESAEENLKSFLSYMNGESPNTVFTKKIEEKINKAKEDEEKRREYMLLRSFEMDARRAGIQEGIAQGAYQNKLETAKILKQLGDSLQKIIQATGLSREEIEKL